MTGADTASVRERKEIDDDIGRKMRVPESTIIGNECRINRDTSFGEMCVLGDNVRIKSSLGNNVNIGDDCDIQAKLIGDNVRIGTGVSIQHDVVVRPGVIIPDNWLIPYGCVVNPGIGGLPVVVTPAPSFRCNINGQLSTGGRGW